MDQTLQNANSVYYRLIALWVLCEAMLGGIIHGFKLPISGLFVGGGAILCIAMIAYYVPAKGSIVKATIIVAVFKMMLSPQSPPPAYIAVFFQGLLGELLFIHKKMFRLSCLLLAVLAMMESAVQRILVLTILYGNSFWKAVNEFLSKLTGEKTVTNYSLYFATGYIIIHVIAGFWVGWFAGVLPKKINQWKQDTTIIAALDNDVALPALQSSKKKKWKLGLLLVWVLLIGLYIQSAIPIGRPLLPPNVPLQVFIRSVLIVLGWYLFLRPVVSRLLQHWLKKKQRDEQATIQQVATVLPSVKHVVQQSWLAASPARGVKRFVLFCKTVTVNIVHAA